MKPIYIFILCYNEEKIINNTLKFYKTRFPDSIITIFDNNSTDNSINIAKSFNCNILTFDSNDIQDDYIFRDLKNNLFKKFVKGESWVLIVDMDEWLDINKDILEKEELNGTTILSVKGYDMIGESNYADLKDIDINKINKCVENHLYDKNVCFLYPLISDINYYFGAHLCFPKGNVKFSETKYKLKHMKYLGLEYLISNTKVRYDRSHKMREKEMCTHYSDNIDIIKKKYIDLLNRSTNYEN